MDSVEKLFVHLIKTFLFLGIYGVQKDSDLNIHRYFLIPASFATRVFSSHVQFSSTSALHIGMLAGILLSTVWTL